MKLKPLGDRIVVKAAEKEEMTKGGLVLPDTVKEKPVEGEVVAVGTGRVLDNGSRQPMEVKVGDRVIYSKYSGTEVKVEEETYLVIGERDVLAVVEK
ncbi:co-chaperone GroES [Synergistes jonesii]|uniref:Co-chaperonin GroES n=1 Tax=Synergistes jonesii TaxID=2754 RepID=A0A073INB1_9BACT|nr:co-chaperone GroES [Synergistes jonesii]KEJ91853.1 molecular chaperone GroES [Synergistes jonesii]MDY2985415.1 co-chaperone GroES [Synergistes jonesii]OFB61013.1 molecular chaperone GroES [Synergistes jonesii]OFB61141.1 molecular chaperone GroES [Synergistes jonesii]OFB62071.1 molecular chaperone GroES [Synergistes jonesii]